MSQLLSFDGPWNPSQVLWYQALQCQFQEQAETEFKIWGTSKCIYTKNIPSPNKLNYQRKILNVNEIKDFGLGCLFQFCIDKLSPIRRLVFFLASKNLFLKQISSSFRGWNIEYITFTHTKMYLYHDTFTKILISYLVVIFLME